MVAIRGKYWFLGWSMGRGRTDPELLQRFRSVVANADAGKEPEVAVALEGVRNILRFCGQVQFYREGARFAEHPSDVKAYEAAAAVLENFFVQLFALCPSSSSIAASKGVPSTAEILDAILPGQSEAGASPQPQADDRATMERMAQALRAAWPVVRALRDVVDAGDDGDAGADAERSVVHAAIVLLLQIPGSRSGSNAWSELGKHAAARRRLSDDEYQDALVSILSSPPSNQKFVPSPATSHAVGYAAAILRNRLHPQRTAPWRKGDSNLDSRTDGLAGRIYDDSYDFGDMDEGDAPTHSATGYLDVWAHGPDSPEPQSRATVWRLKTAGVDVKDPEAVAEALAKNRHRMRHQLEGLVSQRDAAKVLRVSKTSLRRIMQQMKRELGWEPSGEHKGKPKLTYADVGQIRDYMNHRQ